MTDPLDLFRQDGHVAIVTGASSGIGRECASALAAVGATVYAVARRADRLEELAGEIGATAWAGDVTDTAVVHALVADVMERHGRIDVLVNNAGVSHIAKAVDEPVEDFRAILDLNVVAAFELARACARHMMQQATGGAVVNIASIVGLVGVGRMPQAGYAASKGAMVSLTRELAAQWARRHVRVNAIAPGWFHTEMTDELLATPRGVEWVADLTPMGRHGAVSELMGALLLLAGPAGSYITGAVLPVDGGWTAV